MESVQTLEKFAEFLHEDLAHDAKLRSLARTLARNELFDYTLYHAFAENEPPEIARMLHDLAKFEEAHIHFWKIISGEKDIPLRWYEKLKIGILKMFQRMFKTRFTLLILDAIEHYGISKYTELWQFYKNTPMQDAIALILKDELLHEDEILTKQGELKLKTEDLRNFVLGLNDGLVEVLGSVGGFFGAFQNPLYVALAASIVGIAGSISMGAGGYVSVKSERDVKRIEHVKAQLIHELGGKKSFPGELENPIRAALFVGIAYLFGALVPVLPVWLGANSVIIPFIAGILTIAIVSWFLATISGLPPMKKILENVIVLLFATGISYGIGWLAHHFLNIEIG